MTQLYQSKIFANGSTTLPKPVRDALGIKAGDRVRYVIFHLAAINGTWKFYEKPWEVGKNNILPTLNLLERYRNSSAKFVFVSTCEIFNGAVDSGVYSIPTDENVPVMFDGMRK